MPAESLQAWRRHYNKAGDGFMTQEEWLSALDSADADTVLKSRLRLEEEEEAEEAEEEEEARQLAVDAEEERLREEVYNAVAVEELDQEEPPASTQRPPCR